VAGKFRLSLGFGGQSAGRGLYGRLSGLILLAAIFLPLGGCYPVGNIVAAKIAAVSNPPSPLFDEYCAKYGGMHVYKTVKNVRGFVLLPSATYVHSEDDGPSDVGRGGCTSCLNFLGEDGYDFVEARVIQHKQDRVGNYDYAVTPGIYRYRLVKRESGKCERFDALAASRSLHLDFKRLHLEGWCVYAERIPNFTARYEYAPYRSLEVQPRLFQSRSFVRDRVTGEVLAEDFSYFTPNMHDRPGRCHDGKYLGVKDVLKPLHSGSSDREAS